ncbi:hypothetical protein F4818DRAFT_439822 [Hypoxylon cercidicola]|nr:hypothetical protein F4818DRAFT_439822 [Hypoxylon cercidicola]
MANQNKRPSQVAPSQNGSLAYDANSSLQMSEPRPGTLYRTGPTIDGCSYTAAPPQVRGVTKEDFDFLTSFLLGDAVKNTEDVPMSSQQEVSSAVNPPMANRGRAGTGRPVATILKVGRSHKGILPNGGSQGGEVPPSQNCSLHIGNLPPDCTISDLLGSIRDIGKVYASNIRPPTNEYHTAAAKLVFWDRDAVDRFLKLASEGKFTVGRYVPIVRMNNHRAAAQSQSILSRVLLIRGPRQIVEQSYLENFFRKLFRYDLETVVVVDRSEFFTKLEFRFSSYRCQASNAMKYVVMASKGQWIPSIVFTEEEQKLWYSVQPYWGIDPCA